jgi:hypothetical protein
MRTKSPDREIAMSSKTIPVTIPPEVTAFVAEIGLQEPFERILEHALKTVPGLHWLKAELQEPYDLGGDLHVLILGERADPHTEHDWTDMEFGEWKVATFPPQECEYFTLLTHYEPPHAR